MRGNRAQKYLAEILELRGADAVDCREGVEIARTALGHVDQRPVGEDHEGRHLSLPRKAQLYRLERGE